MNPSASMRSAVQLHVGSVLRWRQRSTGCAAVFRRRQYRELCSGTPVDHAEDRHILPKDKAFYAECADKRKYFYVLDTRGQLFLEETMPRNIATSMKDAKFVNFMHKTLKPNVTGEFQSTHPYVSFCGKEINYVSPVDGYSSFCFRDLIQSSTASDGEMELIYGFNIAHPFSVLNLRYHPSSGRIYHKISQHKYLAEHTALLHPFLCQRLANNISWDADCSRYYIEWDGQRHNLEVPAVVFTPE